MDKVPAGYRWLRTECHRDVTRWRGGTVIEIYVGPDGERWAKTRYDPDMTMGGVLE